MDGQEGDGVGDGGWDGRWKAEGGFLHTLEQKNNHCVLNEVQKRAQCSFQAGKVIRSSFTPSVALLVHPKGTIHRTVDCHEFTRS